MDDLRQELDDATEREAATREILRVISRSPSDYQPVFEAILANATRLCHAPLGDLYIRREDGFHPVAHFGGRPEWVEFQRSTLLPLDPALSMSALAAFEGKPLQSADLAEGQLYRDGQPHRVAAVELEGIRSLLAVPMMNGEQSVGVILLYRREVRPFQDKHMQLVSTFADQAVIAIENVRQFQALEAITEERGEALERQSATSEILRVISQSTNDYQPVFEAILDNATRLCDSPLALLLMRENDGFHLVAHRGASREAVEFSKANPLPLDPTKSLTAKVAFERRPSQVLDVARHEHYQGGQPQRKLWVERDGIHTQLTVPMVKGEESLGVIIIYRREIRAFEDSHVELLSTFADQAVIAIENVRRFQALESRTRELGESLERQTAMSDILRVISRSPTDYQPVFEAILENASRLCESPLGILWLVIDGSLQSVATRGCRSEYVGFLTENPMPLEPGISMTVDALLQGTPLQREDVADDALYRAGQTHRVMAVDLEGIRSVVAVPLRRDDELIGVINIYRREVRSFEDKHVELLSTFADQAVIAIENVRLFQALETRSAELGRSVGELRALGEVGQAVSSTLDLETVLTTIIKQAVSLSGADGGAISELDENTGTLPMRAAPGFTELLTGSEPVRIGEGVIGKAAEIRAPVQIPDVDAPGAYTGRLRHVIDKAGLKALLAVPLLREGRVLGTLLVGRNTPGEFPAETVELLGTFAAQSAIAIHNARLFRELEEKGRELEAANRHKSAFLANMSHELRTPLNAVIGFSEVLGEEMFGKLNEKQAEYVEDIHSSGRHLLSLINDILDLSKIEAGRMELDLARFAIRTALDNAMTLVSERASSRGVQLEAEIEESLGEMTGDERKLKQILLNLLSNAIKFTPQGGRVMLLARGVEDAVEILVRDTGVGIAAEDQALIFEEFRQVGNDYARKVEGTGLGLTLTRRFVEMHGGTIGLESEPGSGSEFRIVLPLQPPEILAVSR